MPPEEGVTPQPSPTPATEAPPSPIPTPAPTPSEGGSFGADSLASYVPPEYKDAAYVQGILKSENPTAELWKQFAGLQQVLGRRPAGMPADDAPDEVWQRWAEAVAPKDVSAYGTITPELPEDKTHLKDLLGSAYSPELLRSVTEAARRAGISKKQFSDIVKPLNEFNIQQAEAFHQAQIQEIEAMEQDCDKLFTEAFGLDKMKVHEEGKAFFKEHLPNGLQKHLDKLPNEALVLISGLAYSMKQKYGREDSLPRGGTSGSSTAEDPLSLKSEISKLMSLPEYQNTRDPGHQATMRQVRALQTKLAAKTNFKGF